jgi:carbon-monoxide dehydrogenase small subunit
MSVHRLRFELNGDWREVEVPAHRLLIDLLRDDLGLTGTKEGCSVGVCGACSVLVNGELLSACLLPALFVDGATVRTVEGLAPNGQSLTPLQDAFIRHGGFQCGICTPGQLIAATALLAQHPRPTADEVRRWMMGNLCRCTGYYKIVDSILAAAEVMAGENTREAEPAGAR